MSSLFSAKTLTLTTLLTAGAATAAANTNGWDWDEELQYRSWTDATATWAHNISPSHPSVAVIRAFVAPPPREMWCAFDTMPTPQDCTIHGQRMEAWVQDFAGNTVHFVPSTYPEECPSICY